MQLINAFRTLALSFPGTVELPHFEKASFRVNKKIFASLDIVHQKACLKLTPIDQSIYCAIDTGIIYPVNNKWGKQGWTIVELKEIKKNLLKEMLSKSYATTVDKK